MTRTISSAFGLVTADLVAEPGKARGVCGVRLRAAADLPERLFAEVDRQLGARACS